MHIHTYMYIAHIHTAQACPFTLEVFTEDCEGEIEIVDLLPFNPIVDPALCRLVVERGVCGEVRDGNGELFMYTFTTPHLTTIVVENKVNMYSCTFNLYSVKRENGKTGNERRLIEKCTISVLIAAEQEHHRTRVVSCPASLSNKAKRERESGNFGHISYICNIHTYHGNENCSVI